MLLSALNEKFLVFEAEKVPLHNTNEMPSAASVSHGSNNSEEVEYTDTELSLLTLKCQGWPLHSFGSCLCPKWITRSAIKLIRNKSWVSSKVGSVQSFNVNASCAVLCCAAFSGEFIPLLWATTHISEHSEYQTTPWLKGYNYNNTICSQKAKHSIDII